MYIFSRVSIVVMAVGLALGGCSADRSSEADGSSSASSATWRSNNSMGGAWYDADGNRMDSSAYRSDTNANRPVGVASGMSSNVQGNEYQANPGGYRLDANGNRVDQYGNRIDSKENRLDSSGNQVGSSDAAQYNSNARSGTKHGGDSDMERGWNNPTMIRESDLPATVRSSFQRLSQDNALTETGRTTWNGKTGYCAKTTINGMTYKMATDAEGNLLWMKRADMADKDRRTGN